MKNIVFVGFMSCGKSTIGNAVAKNFGLDFFDTDKSLINLYNMSISNIFGRHGEDHFIESEFEIIKNLLNKEGIISVGGAAFIRPKTFDLIKKNAVSVYIKVTPVTIYHRLKKNNNYQNRPNIISIFERKEESLIIEGISEILQQREIWYSKADITIEILDDEDIYISINKSIDKLKNILSVKSQP